MTEFPRHEEADMLASIISRVTESHEFALAKWLAKLYSVLILIGTDIGARVHGLPGPSSLVVLETHRLDSRTGRMTESDFEELVDEVMFGVEADAHPERPGPNEAHVPMFTRPRGTIAEIRAVRR